MIILMNMYTGRYITEQGNLGHEAINMFRADDGKFYIWLNSMGVCSNKDADNSTVIMVRSVNAKLYKVWAKAECCRLCKGAEIPRLRKNEGVEDKLLRYNAQKELRVTYNGKDPMDQIYKEADMFATFCSPTVFEANGDIYLTSDKALADPEKCIYYADFKISEAMRAYIGENHAAHKDLQDFLDTPVIWKEILTNDYSVVEKSEFNFFKLLRKDRDELSFSNALAYFIQKVGLSCFLQDCLQLDAAFLSDSYSLLREKNNIDISFWGARHVVIIENKIDAYITVDGRQSIDRQIKMASDLYFSHLSDSARKIKETELRSVVMNYHGDVSQLSKYYFFAVAHLLNQGLSASGIEAYIRCFLLVPEYAKKQFEADKDGCYTSPFLLSEKYKIITYKDIYDYFSSVEVDDRYVDDFRSALKPLGNEFNNELEIEMKRRFVAALQ